MTELANAHIVTINEENVQQLLIAESQQRPVLAYFWAEMNKSSLQLMPTLENIANEYGGDFLLAKVNVAEQTMIARQLGVQGLPTAMLIQNGRPIDGFSGNQSESEIRTLLDKYLPKPWDKQVVVAQTLIAEQQYVEALNMLRQAYNDSAQQANIGLQLARVYNELNRLDETELLLKSTPMAAQDALYEQLLAQLHLKRSAAKTPEVETLERALTQNPNDLTLKMQLAIQYQQENQPRKALELLLQIVKTDKTHQDGAARKTMLDIFKSLGAGDPLVTEFQRQLFSLLY